MKKLTLNDINEYITMLRLHYPESFVLSTDPHQREIELTVYLKDMYQDLKIYPKEVCDMAMSNLRRNYKYSKVTTANIIDEIKKLQFACQKSEPELWAEFMAVRGKCIRLAQILMDSFQNGSNQEYKVAKDKMDKFFGSLSKELQRYFVNWCGMLEIARLDDNSLQYEKRTFYKIIREQNERELIRDDNPALKEAIEKGNNDFKLIGGVDNEHL